jgi:hypothetical protein
VGFVEDGVFDEVGRGGGSGDGRPQGWGGAWFAGQQGDDDAQAGDEAGGAVDVEVIGGDAAEQLGGDQQGGGAVFDDGEIERLPGVDVAELAGGRGWAAGGVVVVAEGLVAESGRAAAVSVGEEVAAEVAAVRGGSIGSVGRGVGGCDCFHGISPGCSKSLRARTG